MAVCICLATSVRGPAQEEEFQGARLVADRMQPLKYNHPGLFVDLGVGLWAWPLPMDYDQDGDLDLVVVCPDTPSNGAYFFENAQGNVRHPVFKAGRKISKGLTNAQICSPDPQGPPIVLTPGAFYPDFLQSGFAKPRLLPLKADFHRGKVRANQWKFADLDGDSLLDLVIGIGDWSDYGWDNAYSSLGKWTRGPLHGYVYWAKNQGTNAAPDYQEPRKLMAGDAPVDVYGMPSPNLADFDQDGDLDLLCGEFLDGFTYFQNRGDVGQPVFARGVRLTSGGRPLAMDLQMITPTVIDWDRDGDLDLIVGDEDGRVALCENVGLRGGMPEFRQPAYFQQEAEYVKFGALVTPVSFDWDDDGDEDLLCGNSAGYLGFIENLGYPHETATPTWSAPRFLTAAGEVIRYQAGSNGSIQGPCEAKWGYTTFSIADWDHDGLPDIVLNSILGRIMWHRNLGTRSEPRLERGEPILVPWPAKPPKPPWNWWDPEPGHLVTQWRTTPVAVDWNGDGFNDLVMLDHDGYLALFPREQTRLRRLRLLPGRRVLLNPDGFPQRLTAKTAGASGRRKLCVVDWDEDGRLDVLANDQAAQWFRQLEPRGDKYVLKLMGRIGDKVLAGHTTSPTTVDFDGDGHRELLLGAEDGRLYHLPRD